MTWFIILGVLVIIGAVVLVTTVTKKSADVDATDPVQGVNDEPQVRYRVPDGQDPVVVLTPLREAGYTAVPGDGDFQQVVVIGLREDTAEAREDVRRVIAGARSTNIEGPEVLDPTPVRFEGETGTP